MWSVHDGCPDEVVGRRGVWVYERPACFLCLYMLRGGREVVVCLCITDV